MILDEITPFTTNHIIKLFTDAVGQDAFADFYGTNWEARKKEIQKLQKSNNAEESLTRFVDILNDFTNLFHAYQVHSLGHLNPFHAHQLFLLYCSEFFL